MKIFPLSQKIFPFVLGLLLLAGCTPLFQLPALEVGQPARIYDRKGRLIAIVGPNNTTQVPLTEISPYLPKAVVAVEDERFYHHPGIDFFAIFRALSRNLRAGKIVEGGSTISQQLAKNLFLSQERTVTRKIKEVYYTFLLERQLSKDEILEKYLNTVYFGHGAYGAEAAARIYFGKPARQLTLAESALLAGLLKMPSRLDPFLNFQEAKSRQELVLDRMVAAGMISPAEARAARAEKIVLRPGQAPPGKAPYFVQEVVNYVIGKYTNGTRLLAAGGLSIYTTLDLEMQQAAEEALVQGLKNFDPELEGALVAVEPKSGRILAYVGGRDYRRSPFNRVLARRQPGSAFKPFVYTAAIDNGYTAGTTISCEPTEYPQPDGSVYRPTDYDPAQPYHYRPFTLQEALAISDNVVAVRLNHMLGPEKGKEYAEKMGITSPLRPYLSLVLGTSEVTPLEMATAYATLASGGIRAKPFFITKIVDSRGRVLEENKPAAARVLDEKTCAIVTWMLQGVLKPGGTAAAAGAVLERPAAGKTGTSQNYADAWFVGYTPDIAAAVYIGYDNPTRSVQATGGGIAAPIWVRFINAALKNVPPRDFPLPPGVVKVRICPDSGFLAPPGAPYLEALFVAGTEPLTYCPEHYPEIPPEGSEREKQSFWDWLWR